MCINIYTACVLCIYVHVKLMCFPKTFVCIKYERCTTNVRLFQFLVIAIMEGWFCFGVFWFEGSVLVQSLNFLQ